MTADDLIKVVLEMRQKEPRYIYPKKPHKAA
jgi:hypothetical protein